MLSRLLGLETEYAIRCSPAPGRERLGNDVIYEAILRELSEMVAVRAGEQREKRQMFLENGGAINYEVLPQALAGGLLEASTPECRSPSQLLLYQRAEEDLLIRAVARAEAMLHASGWEGTVGLVKNCRDGDGHTYGAQENYEAEIASGAALLGYRLALLAIIPVLPFELVLFWSAHILVGLTAAIIIFFILVESPIQRALGAFIPALRRRRTLYAVLMEWLVDRDSPLDRHLALLSVKVFRVLACPLVAPFVVALRAFAFRRQRREMIGFLVSRPILTGAGTIDGDTFTLSERASAIRKTMRTSLEQSDRAVFETSNLVKDLVALLFGRIAPFQRLFRRRQRLQLGLSDSNPAQVAEYLKIGTAALVLDMIESGFLSGAPRPKDPIAALHEIGRDASLRARIAVSGTDERSMTAIEIQRFYLDRCRAYVSAQDMPSLEAGEVLRLWASTLDHLEEDRAQLFGKIDWITKQRLVETAGGDLSPAARKKIDLKYHELGEGYLREMETLGLAPTLVDADDIAWAARNPPSETRASVRARLIRALAEEDERVSVSWDAVRIGGRLRGQVIRLEDHRS